MKLNKYMVSPSVPKELEPLIEITKNFWWCWNQKAVTLLRTIDIDNWDKRDHNPIRVLGESLQERFDAMLQDDAAMMNLAEVYDEFKTYMKQETWYDSLDESQKTHNEKIAYFSFEYGLHESLPNYSGGLGILSGDHLKSASDLGLHLVAVGLLYRKGYFRQDLNDDGWQQEYDIENDFFNLALEKVLDKNGETMKVDVDLPGRKVYAQIWKANVGRIELYYLDANIEENSIEDRDITAQLYGGNLETRIQQEILLGIGGVKALDKLFRASFKLDIASSRPVLDRSLTSASVTPAIFPRSARERQISMSPRHFLISFFTVLNFFVYLFAIQYPHLYLFII